LKDTKEERRRNYLSDEKEDDNDDKIRLDFKNKSNIPFQFDEFLNSSLNISASKLVHDSDNAGLQELMNVVYQMEDDKKTKSE
jgi:hypothetical protein